MKRGKQGWATDQRSELGKQIWNFIKGEKKENWEATDIKSVKWNAQQTTIWYKLQICIISWYSYSGWGEIISNVRIYG